MGTPEDSTPPGFNLPVMTSDALLKALAEKEASERSGLTIADLSRLLIESYGLLRRAMESAFRAEAENREARAQLTKSRNEIVAATDPLELGKNEAQREANLRLHLAHSYFRVTLAEEDAQARRNDVELGRMEVEYARALLRLLELERRQ